MKSGLFLTLLMLILIAFASCNETFEPLSQNDIYNFTVFGFLDASADTQWVRIAPAREEFESPDEIPDMAVLLEDLEKGSLIDMNKSLVKFNQGFSVVNAWSDVDIQPGNSYRLSAETPDGKTSSVTVTIPGDFPTPRLAKIERPTLDPEFLLLIEDVEHLVDVQSRWYTRLSTSNWTKERLFTFSNRESIQNIGTNTYTVSMDPEGEEQEIFTESLIASIPDGKIEILHHQIYIASGGPEWDERIPFMDDVVYTLPESFSNVENGLGYMVGIFSKTIPFKNCTDDREVPIACEEEKPFW